MNDFTLETPLIAMVCHEANRAYCESIGDYSQPTWYDAPKWQRDSAINGVEFHRNNPGAGPAVSHNNWLYEKMKDGWTYGPTKDPALKQHPCMVPYEVLPEPQRRKDYLFIAIVEALTKSITPMTYRTGEKTRIGDVVSSIALPKDTPPLSAVVSGIEGKEVLVEGDGFVCYRSEWSNYGEHSFVEPK